jgi:hypothetical protein
MQLAAGDKAVLVDGVIFFRLPGAKLQTKIDQLNTVLTEHTDDLKRGEFLVVTPRSDSRCRSSTCLGVANYQLRRFSQASNSSN